MMLCLVLGTRPPGGAAEPSAFSYLIPLLAILFIYYFILLRPQQKESQRHKKLLESLKKGDEVITDSGLVGTVVAVQDEFVVLKAGETTKLKFLKSKVWSRLSSLENSKDTATDKAKSAS